MEPLLLRIGIVDDDELHLFSFELLFNKTKDFQVVGKGKTGFEAVYMAQNLQPDVILLDHEMPQLLGLEALKEIRKLNLPCKVIMVSTLDLMEESLRAGADGFFQKGETVKELISLVRHVTRYP